MSGPARATRVVVPVKGAMRRSNQASVRPMAALSACAEAEPDAMIAAIWAWSARVRPISVRKAHPKPWQMTRRYGVGEASDHSLSMADIIGRLTAQHLSERLGQQFIVENRPGASTNIGTEYVAKAEPDGYTILLPVSTNAVNVALYRNLNFDFIRDIAPIAGIAKTPFIIVVSPSFPAATLSEFTAYLKANPNKVNVASNGIGSSPHVCAELFQL